MRLALSGIAWDVVEDDAVAAVLCNHGVDAIDIAPGKYFPDFAQATDAEAEAVRARWSRQGIEITGMQSLLFGTVGLNLFGSSAVQARMQAHLGELMRIAGAMGARRLVFGSPRNRDRGSLDDATALRVAVEFFLPLADVARRHGVLLCLEPNPSRYGCNFMRDAESTAQVVRAIDHPAIRMQFDVGAATINGERAAEVLLRHGDLVGHVHASEPDLVPLGDGGADHDEAGSALRHHLPDALVSIEMVATANEPYLASIARALAVAMRCYGGEA